MQLRAEVRRKCCAVLCCAWRGVAWRAKSQLLVPNRQRRPSQHRPDSNDHQSTHLPAPDAVKGSRRTPSHLSPELDHHICSPCGSMSSNKKSSLTGYLPDILMAAAAVCFSFFLSLPACALFPSACCAGATIDRRNIGPY